MRCDGGDPDQRQEFRFNRKQWIEDELKKLSGAMGIHLLGFAILSNHVPFARTRKIGKLGNSGRADTRPCG